MSSKKPIVYIAGPMTGLTDFNRESFKLADRDLRLAGFETRNPAVLPIGWSKYEDYIAVGLAMLATADLVALLPGWEKSKGAGIEAEYAKSNGIPVVEISGIIGLPQNTSLDLESLYTTALNPKPSRQLSVVFSGSDHLERAHVQRAAESHGLVINAKGPVSSKTDLLILGQRANMLNPSAKIRAANKLGVKLIFAHQAPAYFTELVGAQDASH